MPRTTHGEEWWATAPATVLRCAGHYKDGSPCRREASAGTSVCGQHGALIPAVQAAAATRIQMSVGDAVAKLVGWLNDPAVDVRERVKIAHDLLDRGGLGATSKVLLGVVTEDPVEKLFRDLLTREGALAAPAPQIEFVQEQVAIGEADLDAVYAEAEILAELDVVDAVVIEEAEHAPVRRQHTVRVRESMSSAPPMHLRKDLERAEQLRSLL